MSKTPAMPVFNIPLPVRISREPKLIHPLITRLIAARVLPCIDRHMLIRDIRALPCQRVLDGSVLCELLHPAQVNGAGTLPFSIAHAVVPVRETTKPHCLKTSTELFYILSGSGRMHINGETGDLVPGQMVLIPPKSIQYIENTGSKELTFLCIVTPPWAGEDEELAAGC